MLQLEAVPWPPFGSILLVGLAPRSTSSAGHGGEVRSADAESGNIGVGFGIGIGIEGTCDSAWKVRSLNVHQPGPDREDSRRGAEAQRGNRQPGNVKPLTFFGNSFVPKATNNGRLRGASRHWLAISQIME